VEWAQVEKHHTRTWKLGEGANWFSDDDLTTQQAQVASQCLGDSLGTAPRRWPSDAVDTGSTPALPASNGSPWRAPDGFRFNPARPLARLREKEAVPPLAEPKSPPKRSQRSGSGQIADEEPTDWGIGGVLVAATDISHRDPKRPYDNGSQLQPSMAPGRPEGWADLDVDRSSHPTCAATTCHRGRPESISAMMRV
jgi:hypothetical protein